MSDVFNASAPEIASRIVNVKSWPNNIILDKSNPIYHYSLQPIIGLVEDVHLYVLDYDAPDIVGATMSIGIPHVDPGYRSRIWLIYVKHCKQDDVLTFFSPADAPGNDINNTGLPTKDFTLQGEPVLFFCVKAERFYYIYPFGRDSLNPNTPTTQSVQPCVRFIGKNIALVNNAWAPIGGGVDNNSLIITDNTHIVEAVAVVPDLPSNPDITLAFTPNQQITAVVGADTLTNVCCFGCNRAGWWDIQCTLKGGISSSNPGNDPKVFFVCLTAVTFDIGSSSYIIDNASAAPFSISYFKVAPNPSTMSFFYSCSSVKMHFDKGKLYFFSLITTQTDGGYVSGGNVGAPLDDIIHNFTFTLLHEDPPTALLFAKSRDITFEKESETPVLRTAISRNILPSMSEQSRKKRRRE